MRLSNLEKIMIITIITVVLLVAQPFAPPAYAGPDVLPDPVQVNFSSPDSILISGKNGYVPAEAVASYQVNAGVRSRRNYRTDYSAQVSPMDLVLAWGTLNQDHMIEQVSYRQSGRWYYYSVPPEAPVTNGYVGLYSANTHIIPADDLVLKELRKIRKNSYVEMDGYLVNVLFESGPWKTSLTRNDSGAGACEIFYVTHIVVY